MTGDLTTSIDSAQCVCILRPFQIRIVHFALGVIILLGIGMRLYNLEIIGDGNAYYTAAIESMLQSPSNFFFAAAEPGGSVTVDKPPLGLWIQAIFAMFLGVSGVAVTLPQVIAGVLSIPLLYILVKRYFGMMAGLLAAFILTVTPVVIAVERNNTMDATLSFVLLLAAGAFMRATDTGKLRCLLLGGALIGVGFNIKMLQAFLPVPALYALYFLGVQSSTARKISYLAITSAVLAVVSLSWAIIVDLTPADQRPYIGSSENNTVMGLIIGYNGLNRLTGDDSLPGSGASGGGDGTLNNEIGQPGVLRLFTHPLANEISWLLPFGLFSMLVVGVGTRLRCPLSAAHKGLILWGGWLMTAFTFFAIARFYHAYYLAMLAPPLAALVAMGILTFWRLYRIHPGMTAILTIFTITSSVAFQFFTASQYMNTDIGGWRIPAGLPLVIGGGALIYQSASRTQHYAAIGFTCVTIALLVIPTIWAVLTTTDQNPGVVLPHAYAGTSDTGGVMGANERGAVHTQLITYLQENTQDTEYLIAVESANVGSSIVLASQRPVLYVGGFNGSNEVVNAADLMLMVDAGELRYVLWSSFNQGMHADITEWLQTTCTVVHIAGLTSQAGGIMRGGRQLGVLYQCSG